MTGYDNKGKKCMEIQNLSSFSSHFQATKEAVLL